MVCGLSAGGEWIRTTSTAFQEYGLELSAPRGSRQLSTPTSLSGAFTHHSGPATMSRSPICANLDRLLAQERVHLGGGKRGLDIAEGAVFPHLFGGAQQPGYGRP